MTSPGSWTLFGSQRSIFVRFRRTRARFPSPTLYSPIPKGFLSHPMPKNVSVRCVVTKDRVRTLTSEVVTGVSRDENNSKKVPGGRNID